MVRRVCAALLAVMLNGADTSATTDVDDDSSDSGRPGFLADDGDGASKSSSSASVRGGARQGHPWRGDSRLAMSRHASATVGEFGLNVGVVALAGVIDEALASDVLRSALSVCRDRGDLKVIVLLTGCDGQIVLRECERSGFTFASAARDGGRQVFELYTDLYYDGRAA